MVLSDVAIVHYKVTQPYFPGGDRTVAWNDPAIGIDWPVASPILSAKDGAARQLAQFAAGELPTIQQSR